VRNAALGKGTLRPGGLGQAARHRPASGWRRVWPLALLGVVLLAAAIDRLAAPAPLVPPAETLLDLPLAYGPRDYGEALALADRNLAGACERVAYRSADWAHQEALARTLLARARLTGSFDDLAAADSAAQRGMALAPPGSGPVFTAAMVALAVHRQDDAARIIAAVDDFAVPPDAAERAEAEAIAGDAAFYRGRYAEAQRRYQAGRAAAASGGIAYRQAVWQARMGDADGAIRAFVEAARLTRDRNAPLVTDILRQSGMVALQSGDWDRAERLFALADQRFPGHWLTRAYRAQLDAARGRLPAAARAYRAILADAPRPEVMDALALVLRAQGRIAESARWAARAGAIWDRRLAALPDAAGAHAAEHALAFGDPARALAIADQAYRARPYGETATVYAAAAIAAGEPQRAIAAARRELAAGWRTAALYRLLSDAEARAGNGPAADRARRQALALDRHAYDDGVAMIRFGHY